MRLSPAKRETHTGWLSFHHTCLFFNTLRFIHFQTLQKRTLSTTTEDSSHKGNVRTKFLVFQDRGQGPGVPAGPARAGRSGSWALW